MNLSKQALIHMIEQEYRMTGVILTAHRLRNDGYEIDDAEFANFLKHPDTRLSLGARGIDLPAPAQNMGSSAGRYLTPEQIAVANEILDPHVKLTPAAICKKYGVTTQQYRAWCKNPTFFQYLQTISADMFTTSAPEVKAAHLKKIQRGDTRAMELYYAMTGEYDPRQKQELNLEYILIRVGEAAIKCFSGVEHQSALMNFVEELKSIAETPNGRPVVRELGSSQFNPDVRRKEIALKGAGTLEESMEVLNG